MFEEQSRYHDLESIEYVEEGQQTVVYKTRRFLSRRTDWPSLPEVEVGPGDRPDLVAERTAGRPVLFWQVCDANQVMNPFELTERIGRKLKIPMPGVR